MRFGCCSNMLARAADGTGSEWLEQLHELGFDYVELPLAQTAALSDADFEALERTLQRAAIGCEACNNFFPTAMRLTGPDVDPAAIMNYAVPALERAARLGARIVVFGSGPAKRVPPGFPKYSAWLQLVDLLTAMARPAQSLGLTVAIEPLRRQECNIVNTAAEGLSLIEAVNSEQIKLLVDFFHLDSEKESPDIISAAGEQLCHVHLARPEGRRFPALGDLPVFAPFALALRTSGYGGRISIEAYSDDLLTDAPGGLTFLRRAFAS